MGALGPMFIDVTWGAGGSTSTQTQDICAYAHKEVGLDTQMHLTCTNMEVEKFKDALNLCKQEGIRNILALRGDPPRGKQWEAIKDGFAHGDDLVRYIRAHYGDYFCVGAAGYPEGHPDATSYEEEMYWLRRKVAAGVDLVISQLFYDVDLFLKWMQDCRSIGITCPILPGIMPVQNYGGFQRMTQFCKTYVPPSITAALEPLKNDEAKVKDYGHVIGVEMCRRLLKGGVPGLHFYTLNLEVMAPNILQTLGMVKEAQVVHHRELPWHPEARSRKGEQVRPVFWANRPESYVARTRDWDDFPNGRWGDARSPAFSGAEDVGGHSSSRLPTRDEKRLAQRPVYLPQQLWDLFAEFLEGHIPTLPWIEGPLNPETGPIQQKLLKMNRHGFLTINSQPRVNGLPSHHSIFGWGPGGGYVYQKAYVEFFCPPSHWAILEAELARRPAITYHAVNLAGATRTNHSSNSVTALTWGVFPGKEIVQPTVVDPKVFQTIWKDEAFSLWHDRWIDLVTGASSKTFLEKCYNEYWLVNMVDNDYVQGDLFAAFMDVIDRDWPFPEVAAESPVVGGKKQ